MNCENSKFIKKGNVNSQSTQSAYTQNPVSEDNYLEITITKSNFTINNGYRLRSSFKDDQMYDYLLPIFSETLKTRNSNNFEDVYKKIMIDSGVIRDSNIGDILD